MDLDLRKLRYFVAVAEELNYGRAADRLHIAQPVLSRQIAQLERELGTVLLHRSKQGTELSPAGALLLDDARTLLGQAAAMQRRARVSGRGRTHFSVGFMPGVTLTPLVRELRARFPDLSLDVVRTGWEDQVDVVHDGRVDLSFVRLPVPRADLTIVPLYTEPRLVVLAEGHPLAARRHLTLADIARLDLLQPPDFHPDWRDAAAAARPGALTTGRAALPSVSTVEEKLEHVAQGRGIVILPRSATEFYTRADVVCRPVDGLGPGETGVAYAPGRPSPVLAAAVELAKVLFTPEADPSR